jgi:hypothetical protein
MGSPFDYAAILHHGMWYVNLIIPTSIRICQEKCDYGKIAGPISAGAAGYRNARFVSGA